MVVLSHIGFSPKNLGVLMCCCVSHVRWFIVLLLLMVTI